MGTDWLEQLPVLGNLPAREAAKALREIGEDDTASALEADPDPGTAAYSLLARRPSAHGRAWQHTAHAIGYLPPVGLSSLTPIPLVFAGTTPPDLSLKGAAVKLTLDGLRIADYPGRGTHRILFDFAVQNQTKRGGEQVHFHATYRAAEGEEVAVLGRPLFVGLQVGNEGLFLQCATINVLNEADEGFLAFLDAGVFKSGLHLLTTAQPALAPFSAMALAVTRNIASRNRNVTVQAVDLGLDFSTIATRARLAEGSYLAVQIPQTLRTVWEWENWQYDPMTGRLVSVDDPTVLIPYNYFIVSVSRYER